MDRKKLFKDWAIMVGLAVLAGAGLFSALKNFAPSFLLTASIVNIAPEEAAGDVQKYIELTYPNSQKTRAALKQIAKTIEASIKDADNKDISLAHQNQRVRSYKCLLYMYRALEAKKMFNELLNQIADTPERSSAYKKANKYLFIKLFTSLSEAGGTPEAQNKFNCDFDPDKMAD